MFGNKLNWSAAEGTPIHPEAGEQDFTSTNWRHQWDQSSNYQSFQMMGPTHDPVTLVNQVTRNNDNLNNSPSLQDQILNHVSSLKALIKQHNERSGTLIEPIWLSFGDEDGNDKGKGVDKWAKDAEDEEHQKPYKEVLKSLFTWRIIKFSAPKYCVPTNLRIYNGSTDLDDHVSRFVRAANQGEWNMPVWCRMFQHRLDGPTRDWFDRLPNGCIDNWADLREKLIERFTLRRICFKDPTEVSQIIQRANEMLADFKERGTDEMSYIHDVPEVMQISAFMSNSKFAELARRFSDQVPKTVTEMMKKVDDFIKSEEVYRSTELPRGESPEKGLGVPPRGNRPPRAAYGGGYHRTDIYNAFNNRRDHYQPYVLPRANNRRNPKKENLDRYCDYHGEKRHYTNDCYPLKRKLKATLESGKLIHLVKDVMQIGSTKGRQQGNNNGKGKVINLVWTLNNNQKRKSRADDEDDWMNIPITFPPVLPGNVSDETLILEAEVEGYLTELVGFSGEQLIPLGKIELEPRSVEFRNLKAYVEDMIIKSKTEQEMIMDIAETFDNLRKISLSNEAEYKALPTGLQIDEKMKVHALKVKVDSKLVAYQLNGDFVACSEHMAWYLAKEKKHIALFKKFTIQNIPRNLNQKADVLSKLASDAFDHLTKEVLVEILNSKFVNVQEINMIIEEEGDKWMTLIINCLEEGVWLEDKKETRNLHMKASYVIREMHEGACEMHSGPKSIMEKIMRQVYYWPTMPHDTKFGLPRLVVMDNKTHLVNNLFKSWCEKLKIKQMNTAVAYLQANGLHMDGNLTKHTWLGLISGRNKENYNSTRILMKNVHTVHEDGVAISSDGVRTLK
ncbi:reverse transcriptase domain-containing protein [Tanacetum coccineum]